MTLADQIRDALMPPEPDVERLLELAYDVARIETALDLIVADAGADARLIATLVREAGHG